jgi:spore coat protein U-like protein
MHYLALICLFFTTNMALAATVGPSTEMQVTATVSKFCTASATPLTFGHYSHEELVGRITVTVNCTAGTQYYIGVNQSAGKRSMLGSKNESLRYSLYSDASRSRSMGNTIGQNTISGIGTGTTDTITIYAVIQGEQYVSPGSYNDNLDISLNF